MAFWLSPQNTQIYLQHIQSQSHIAKRQLEELSMLLATLLRAEPNTVSDMATRILLEKQLAEQKIETEKAQTFFHQRKTLPHSTYGCSLSNDGVSWIAKINLAEGGMLVGRGESPAKALNDFDEQWLGLK